MIRGHLRSFFAPPEFADREQTRRCQTLHGASTIILLMAVVWFMMNAASFGLDPFRLGGSGLLVIASTFARRAATQGRWIFGGRLLIFPGWFALTINALASGHVAAPTYAGFTALVVAGGLVRGAPGAFAMAGLSALSAATITWLEQQSMLPPATSPHTPWTLFGANVVALISGAGLLAIADFRTRSILAEATAAEKVALEARSALEASQDHLIRAQKMDAVGRVAGAIAHDFNNNLTVISGFATLAENSIGDHPARDFMNEIREASVKSAVLTRQLLSFGRKQSYDPEVVELKAYLCDQADVLGKILGERIQLELELPPHPATIYVDPTQLEQVVLNLVLNARDAMHSGGRLIIAIRIIEDGDQSFIELVVRDSGDGMDAETLARATEAFYTTKDVGRGSGLGLASVATILERSEGTLQIESMPGEGTTVTCRFPPAHSAAPAVVDVDEPDEAPQGQRELIWLVEDQAGLRRLVRQVLETAGYRVIEANGWADLKTALTETPEGPDLLLTDVVLEGHTGPEIVARLQETLLKLKVLYMSGYLGNAMVAQGLLPSEVDLIKKPFRNDELLRRVRHALDRIPA